MKKFKISEQIPEIKIGVKPGYYGLAGWEELDRWARLNLTLWAHVTKDCELGKMNEETRLKMLVYGYLKAYAATSEEYVEYRSKNPAPVIGPDGQVWRYIGP